jgi:hypothetical protein
MLPFYGSMIAKILLYLDRAAASAAAQAPRVYAQVGDDEKN